MKVNRWVIFLLLFSFAVYGEIRNEPIALYLTWEKDPTTTMVIQWVTSPDQHDDEIYYKKETDETWKIAVGSHAPFPWNDPFLLHGVKLTNLAPDGVYLFRAGCQGKEYKFRTMPQTFDAPIRFVVGGDMYHDDVKSLIETTRQAAAQEPSFALVGGDLAYAGSRKFATDPEKRRRWLTWLIAWKQYMVTPQGFLVPMIPAIGNHDLDLGDGQGKTPHQAGYFYFLFPFPGQQGCNALDFGDYLSVIALDTDHTHPIPGAQTFWLYQALQNRQHIPHKIAFYHIPAFPSVREFKGEHSTQIRDNWVPAFEQFGLSTAFEHHDHAYKRTYPLYQDKIDFDRGVLYMGDGAWGVKKPRKPRLPTKGSYLAATASQRHFILVTLTKDYRYYHAIDYKGNVIDAYVQEVVRNVPESVPAVAN